MVTTTKVIAVVVLLVGILGLLMGDRSLGGALNIDIAEDIIHILTGALLWYAAVRWGSSAAKNVFWTLGVVYLLVGILGFINPTMYGLLPSGLSVVDNLIHLVVAFILMYFGSQQRVVRR